jgi:hypothetical protein
MVFVPKQKAPASAASSAGAVTATARGVAEAADAAMKDKLRGDHLPEREELAQLLQQRQAQRGVAGSGCGYRHCQKPAAGVSCSSCSYGPVYCSAACVVRGALRWAGLAGSLPLGSGCLAEHLPPGCRRRRMLRPSLASGAAGRPCAGPACNPLQSSANSARGAAQRGLPRLSCAPPPSSPLPSGSRPGGGPHALPRAPAGAAHAGAHAGALGGAPGAEQAGAALGRLDRAGGAWAWAWAWSWACGWACGCALAWRSASARGAGRGTGTTLTRTAVMPAAGLTRGAQPPSTPPPHSTGSCLALAARSSAAAARRALAVHAHVLQMRLPVAAAAERGGAPRPVLRRLCEGANS